MDDFCHGCSELPLWQSPSIVRIQSNFGEEFARRDNGRAIYGSTVLLLVLVVCSTASDHAVDDKDSNIMMVLRSSLLSVFKVELEVLAYVIEATSQVDDKVSDFEKDLASLARNARLTYASSESIVRAF